jgi:hypothetical protein
MIRPGRSAAITTCRSRPACLSTAGPEARVAKDIAGIHRAVQQEPGPVAYASLASFTKKRMGHADEDPWWD